MKDNENRLKGRVEEGKLISNDIPVSQIIGLEPHGQIAFTSRLWIPSIGTSLEAGLFLGYNLSSCSEIRFIILV